MSGAATATPEGDDGSPDWRRTLTAMVAVQVVMSLSFTFVSPILPLFLPDVGIANDRQLYLWAGALTAITSLMAALVSPIWGRMADRYGRKLMVLRSCIAIAACTALMGVAQSVWHLLSARILMGAFAGFSAASVILVSTQVPRARLGYALGLMSSGQLIGSLLGPVLGGALADVTASYRIPFFVSGALSLAATLLCWWSVPETFKRPENTPKTPVLAAYRQVGGIPGMMVLVTVLFLSQFATQAVQPIVALYVQSIVGDQPNLATLGGVALSVTGLAGVVAVPLLARSGDRYGEKAVLVVALVGAALATAPQAWVGSYWGFVIERLSLGLFVGSIVPITNALIAKVTPASERGMTFGVTSSAYFLGNSLGPASGGVIAAYAGLPWVFVVTTVMLLAGAVWVAAAVPRRTSP
ncbi:MAG: multidrug efflux MFS transporter [Alphaproteobacteria bacterium]|nr:multidrug efflux MFS transporter [Alphaproteobacteria bacterium]